MGKAQSLTNVQPKLIAIAPASNGSSDSISNITMD